MTLRGFDLVLLLGTVAFGLAVGAAFGLITYDEAA